MCFNKHIFVVMSMYFLNFLSITRGQEPGEKTQASFVPLSSYPYVVIIKMKNKNTFCAGSLITSKWVLSVAHCFENENNTSIRIFLGIVSKEVLNSSEILNGSDFQVRDSVELIRPWSSANQYFYGDSDLALIAVAYNFECTKWFDCKRPSLKLVLAPHSKKQCDIVGYNIKANFLESFEPNHLERYKIAVQKQCSENIRLVAQSESKHRNWICQIDNQTLDSTFTDYGALLLCRGKSRFSLCGLAVKKFKAAKLMENEVSTDHREPVIFLDICPYLSWIRSYVGPTIIKSPGKLGLDCYYGSSFQRNPASHYVYLILLLVYKQCQLF